jgi:hypothetical protein
MPSPSRSSLQVKTGQNIFIDFLPGRMLCSRHASSIATDRKSVARRKVLSALPASPRFATLRRSNWRNLSNHHWSGCVKYVDLSQRAWSFGTLTVARRQRGAVGKVAQKASGGRTVTAAHASELNFMEDLDFRSTARRGLPIKWVSEHNPTQCKVGPLDKDC